jgi:hypothetical protein
MPIDVKYWAHAARHRMLRYRPSKSGNVAVFGIRRGGSTLLADMIAAQPGVFYYDEPFAVFDGHQYFDIKSRYLPRRPHSQFFALSEAEKQSVCRYMNLMQQCRLPHGWIPKPKPLYVADRILYKILNAPALIDWFATEFNLRIAFMIRHPAAQALSVLRNRWGFSAEAYFADEGFMTHYFTEEQREFGLTILRQGSNWEKSILNWVMEVFVPLYCSEYPLLRLSYEELVLAPRATARVLAETFDLDDIDALLDAAYRPSGSSRMCTSRTLSLIRNDKRQELVNKWEKALGADQRQQAQDILDKFKIDIYSMRAFLPAENWLISRETAKSNVWC